VRRVKSLLVCAFLSVLLAACAGGGPRSVSQADLDAHIAEAAGRFDMPELWVREVIRQESGGRTMVNGRPIVSKAGAMGLMQVMPGTYEEMRRKHGLGSDPYDPHDNIIAGTAYLREMYNLFGAPGFLGAYNCGPGCYGDYLAGKRSLPGETRRYMASVSPRLNRTTAPNGADIVVASAADNAPFAAASPPPPPAASAPAPLTSSSTARAPVAVAVLPPPPSASRSSYPPAAPTTQVVAPDTTAPIAPATVSTAALRGGATGAWTVQLGAFRSADDSARVINRARQSLPGMLSHTQKIVQAVDTQTGPLYRARLSGLSQRDAAATCSGLVDLGMACFVVAPGA
jgi:D-alanyl-D-alanine carboxypeptidase